MIREMAECTLSMLEEWKNQPITTESMQNDRNAGRI